MRRSLLALALLGAALACAPEPLEGNLLLVSLDTTRPDHLGCYGYARDTSPHLDRLAAEGVVFERAFTTSSWTLPAHASLFTGLFPTSHGARMDPRGALVLGDAIRGEPGLRRHRVNGLGPGPATLAELLAERGFVTGAVVAGPWMKRIFGLDRGFAHYDDAGITSVRGRLAVRVTDAALAWLDRVAGERFFLFLNYYDPHSPYGDPAGEARRFLPPDSPWPILSKAPPPAVASALYDGEIRYMDAQLGRLFEELRRRELFDSTWIIVTADHGELLGEHGLAGHGKTLYQEEIRIPLIVKYPAAARRTGSDEAPVQLTDIFGLVLERYGLERPPAAARRAPVFAEVYRPANLGGSGDWRVLLDGPHKFHWNSRGARLLFDVESDPAERYDLADADPARVAAWERRLEAFLAALPAALPGGPEGRVDEQTRRALEELGYLE